MKAPAQSPFDRDRGKLMRVSQLVPTRSQIEFVKKITERKEIIKSWWWCSYICSLPASRRVFSSPLRPGLRNITSRWIKLIPLFYIRRGEQRRGKELRSRWYSIGIGWLKKSFVQRSMVRGFQIFNATRCLRKRFLVSIRTLIVGDINPRSIDEVIKSLFFLGFAGWWENKYRDFESCQDLASVKDRLKIC